MSKLVRIGDVVIGGGNPVAIQSMTNVDSHDKKGLIRQIEGLSDVGCDIVRIAVPDREAAEVFGEVKNFLRQNGLRTPLVADIHFDYRLAVLAMEKGADKVRINPGNIGDITRLKAVVDCAKERDIPIRVGVNSGSLEKPLLAKYGAVTAEALAESAINNLKLIEDLGYDNLVVSLKASQVVLNHRAHKLLAGQTEHPIHIGVTEAGTLKMGRVKSSVGIGALLLEGIGDTMRVSLTADPVEEVLLARDILRSLDMLPSTIDVVSCPTCGRTRINLEALAAEVEEKLKPLEEKLAAQGRKSMRIAVMGCAVNGPGEAAEADFGVAGGDGKGLIFKKGKIIKTVEERQLAEELIVAIEEDL